jgi:hypothetical protein
LLDQPTKDLRYPITEDAHFRIPLTTRRIDHKYLERFGAVLFQHDNQLTAINRSSHIEVERMHQTEASERACEMSVAIVDQDAVPSLDFEWFIVHKKFDRRYSTAGVGEIASYREALVGNLLWVRRHTVSSDV